MEIGFTGTRDGMTDLQKEVVRNILAGFWVDHSKIYHGCCVGADADFHHMARQLGFHISGHPAYEIGHEMRANLDCDELEKIMPPLDRNSVIVAKAQILIATPKEMAPIQRSGTWSTIRKVQSPFKAHYIVFPDGRVHTGRPGQPLGASGAKASSHSEAFSLSHQ